MKKIRDGGGCFPPARGEEKGGQAGEDLRVSGGGVLQGRRAGTEVSFLWVLSSGT